MRSLPPLPADIVGKGTTDKWPCDACNGIGHADEAGIPGTLFSRHDEGNDGVDTAIQPCTTDACDDAADNQRRAIPGRGCPC